MPDELPIIIHQSILHDIREYYANKKIDDSATAFYLYGWLYETARTQNNNQVWASNTFLKKKIGCGEEKLKRVKAALSHLGLISYVKKKSINGRQLKTYIKVNHVWGKNSINNLSGNYDFIVSMAKKYLVSNFIDGEEICSVSDIGLNELVINGSVLSLEDGAIYIEERMIIIDATLINGNTITQICPTEMVQEIIMKLYIYVTEIDERQSFLTRGL